MLAVECHPLLDIPTRGLRESGMMPRMPPALLTLGQRVKMLRQAKDGLIAEDAAAQIGISRATLSSIENGHDLPGRETLFAIANFYGVSTEYLRNGSTIEAPKVGDVINDVDECAWMALWRGMSNPERMRLLIVLQTAGRMNNGNEAA